MWAAMNSPFSSYNAEDLDKTSSPSTPRTIIDTFQSGSKGNFAILLHGHGYQAGLIELDRRWVGLARRRSLCCQTSPINNHSAHVRNIEPGTTWPRSDPMILETCVFFAVQVGMQGKPDAVTVWFARHPTSDAKPLKNNVMWTMCHARMDTMETMEQKLGWKILLKLDLRSHGFLSNLCNICGVKMTEVLPAQNKSVNNTLTVGMNLENTRPTDKKHRLHVTWKLFS